MDAPEETESVSLQLESHSCRLVTQDLVSFRDSTRTSLLTRSLLPPFFSSETVTVLCTMLSDKQNFNLSCALSLFSLSLSPFRVGLWLQRNYLGISKRHLTQVASHLFGSACGRIGTVRLVLIGLKNPMHCTVLYSTLSPPLPKRVIKQKLNSRPAFRDNDPGLRILRVSFDIKDLAD